MVIDYLSLMDCHKVLILRLSAVGDVIRTLPAVKALREWSSSSYIAWIVEEPSEAFLKSQPEIDEVILFPRKRWTDGIKSLRKIGRTITEIWKFIFYLRGQRFDIVFDFHGILKSGLLSFLSGSPKRVGFDRRSSKEWNFLFSNIRVRLPEKKMNRFQRNFKLLNGIGLDVKRVNLKLHIPEKDKGHIALFLNTLSHPLKKPCIAIHPGTSPKTFYKRWMFDRYAQLADRLVLELKATVMFTWGPGELEWVKGIQREMKEPSILSPRTESLTQLGEIFRRCDLYIGGDTGPMHIASFVGTPVVIIFGPTDPQVNEPLGHHKKVRKDVECSPCRKRSCEKLSCLRAVTVDDVFKAAREILGTFISPNVIEDKRGDVACR